ncbi:hypothetical protein P8918_12625 [Bacillus spizizenii]|nr:hypothetical protein [Bacillus spizizenii]MEC0841869.1 hypothetical protein [Bacillus spizizenii]
MGTRHLIAVAKDGEYKVAQYGQWDGYPEGQGVAILEFLRAKMKREVFEERLNHVSFITEKELKERWIKAGADPDNDLITIAVSNRMSALYPENTREIGSGILRIIQGSERDIKISNSIDFAGDSLFCEWGYVIDLDKNTFEVYKGFNHEELDKSERFFGMKKEGEYNPIKLVKSFDLDNLPTPEDFATSLQKEEELV